MTDIAVLVAGVAYETSDPAEVERLMGLLIGVSERVREADLGLSVAVHTAAATSPEALSEMVQRYLDAAAFRAILIFGANGVGDFVTGGMDVRTLLTERGSEDHLVLFPDDTLPVRVSFLPRITKGSRGLASRAAIAKIKTLAQTIG